MLSGFRGWWISPVGKVYNLKDKRHIQFIVGNLDKFKLSPSVKKQLDKLGRNVSEFSDVRNKGIAEAIGQNWIRVREYKNRGYTTYNFKKLTKDAIERIKKHGKKIKMWDADIVRLLGDDRDEFVRFGEVLKII